jgi:hypothetical protein
MEVFGLFCELAEADAGVEIGARKFEAIFLGFPFFA